MKKILLYSFILSGLVAAAVNLEWMAINDVQFDTVIIGRVTNVNVNPWSNGLYIGYNAAANAVGVSTYQETASIQTADYDSDYGYFLQGGLDLTDFHDVQNAYYYMELKSGDNYISYSDLVPYSTVKWATVGNDYWTVSSFQPVPEPSSGLLLLIGGALVGLRRKRRVA